jgi:hypothetical protein
MAARTTAQRSLEGGDARSGGPGMVQARAGAETGEIAELQLGRWWLRSLHLACWPKRSCKLLLRRLTACGGFQRALRTRCRTRGRKSLVLRLDDTVEDQMKERTSDVSPVPPSRSDQRSIAHASARAIGSGLNRACRRSGRCRVVRRANSRRCQRSPVSSGGGQISTARRKAGRAPLPVGRALSSRHRTMPTHRAVDRYAHGRRNCRVEGVWASH